MKHRGVVRNPAILFCLSRWGDSVPLAVQKTTNNISKVRGNTIRKLPKGFPTGRFLPAIRSKASHNILCKQHTGWQIEHNEIISLLLSKEGRRKETFAADKYQVPTSATQSYVWWQCCENTELDQSASICIYWFACSSFFFFL